MGTTTSGPSPNAMRQQNNIDPKAKNLKNQKSNKLEPTRIQNEQPKSVGKQKTDLLPKRDEYLLLGQTDYFKKSKCNQCKTLNTFICEHDTDFRDEIHNSFLNDGSYHISPRKSNEKSIDYKMYLNSAKSKQKENKNENLKAKTHSKEDLWCSCCFCCETTQ